MTAEQPKSAKAGTREAQHAQSGIVRTQITKAGATIKVIQLNLSAEMIKGLSVGSARLPSASK